MKNFERRMVRTFEFWVDEDVCNNDACLIAAEGAAKEFGCDSDVEIKFVKNIKMVVSVSISKSLSREQIGEFDDRFNSLYSEICEWANNHSLRMDHYDNGVTMDWETYKKLSA